MRYSLRLILVPVDAVGGANVKPSADVELAQMDLKEDDTRLSMQQLSEVAQRAIRTLMEG